MSQFAKLLSQLEGKPALPYPRAMNPARIAHLSILIVDDHDAMRSILERMLRAAGAINLRTAPDPADALAQLARTPADLIIADQFMPGMTGLEFISALRADSASAHARILMITGDAALAEEAKAAGANAILAKPITAAAEVLDAIEAALAG